jgi:hypothetical protein
MSDEDDEEEMAALVWELTDYLNELERIVAERFPPEVIQPKLDFLLWEAELEA